MTGEPLSRFILPDDRPAFRECLQRARDSETGSSAEVRILAGEPATTINTEVTANTVDHLAESGADGFRLSITDISELKRIEQELRGERANLERRIKQRTAELQSANESLRKEIEAREEIEQKLRRNQIRLRALASELTKTEERQRSRLARDLHDLVAQTLAVAKMKLSTMIQRVDDEEVADALHETEDLVQQMVEATREILTELSPPVLEEQDVPTAMEWLVDYLRDKYELNAELDTVAESAQLSDEKRRFLFRSVRELLLNVARHAEAEHAWVDLSTEDGSIVLTVQDDGHGFNVAEARRSSGFGIFSIQQRVEDLGGSFVLDSSVGEGTRSVLTLPHG
jgi:signal transduction histidine kinase